MPCNALVALASAGLELFKGFSKTAHLRVQINVLLSIELLLRLPLQQAGQLVDTTLSSTQSMHGQAKHEEHAPMHETMQLSHVHQQTCIKFQPSASSMGRLSPILTNPRGIDLSKSLFLLQ